MWHHNSRGVVHSHFVCCAVWDRRITCICSPKVRTSKQLQVKSDHEAWSAVPEMRLCNLSPCCGFQFSKLHCQYWLDRWAIHVCYCIVRESSVRLKELEGKLHLVELGTLTNLRMSLLHRKKGLLPFTVDLIGQHFYICVNYGCVALWFIIKDERISVCYIIFQLGYII